MAKPGQHSPLHNIHNFHTLFNIQLFETLQPGSDGILTEVGKISKVTFRKGAHFLRDIFSEIALLKHNLEPLKEKSEEND